MRLWCSSEMQIFAPFLVLCFGVGRLHINTSNTPVSCQAWCYLTRNTVVELLSAERKVCTQHGAAILMMNTKSRLALVPIYIGKNKEANLFIGHGKGIKRRHIAQKPHCNSPWIVTPISTVSAPTFELFGVAVILVSVSIIVISSNCKIILPPLAADIKPHRSYLLNDATKPLQKYKCTQRHQVLSSVMALGQNWATEF